jgi:16S rRNA (uracil1498-N3)-methyltransferase
MSRRRLFVPPQALSDARVMLTGDAHRHLARVLRARAGDTLTLFDGAGTEVDARIVRVDARQTELAAGVRRTVPDGTRAVAITLLVAVPRGERMDLLVQKTTELGVGRIVPIVTGRSVSRPAAGTVRRPRWEKIAQEAARQCGRADVPRIDDPLPLADAISAPDLPGRRLALWEAERGRSLRGVLADGSAAPGRAAPATALLVGPEGGFAPEEVALAQAAGFVPVGLGPRILRVETAAIVAVALVQAAAGGLE